MATSTKKSEGGITKLEAVRRGLAELGKDAKPVQLQQWVKATYGITMTADHVSTYKSSILRKAGSKGKKPAAVAQASIARNEEPQVRRAPPPRGGISLDDIAAVKGLVGRVGPDSLKKLIDVLAR
jgi:hypothetical protein